MKIKLFQSFNFKKKNICPGMPCLQPFHILSFSIPTLYPYIWSKKIMKENSNSDIQVGSVVFLKSDADFKLPMIVKSLPSSSFPEAHLVWIGSQKTMVRGYFPIESIITKPIEDK
ncbi:MAG: hypothetical protein RBS07_09760 [Lentimicrobium sp.]|jgi:hypothetical protein|nr:hypothetical protein [Lentimicrobium sp.]